MVIKGTAAVAALVAGGLVVGAGRASAVPVANPSFEQPAIDLNTNPFGAQPGAAGWTTTGGNNTGIFVNPTADDPVSGSRRIQNADGRQLAFIGVQGTGGTGVGNEFSQVLAESYQPGQAYALSLGLAESSVQPPTPVGAALFRFQFFYTDTGGARQTVGAPRTIVDDAATGVRNDLLQYFTAQTPVVVPGDAFAGRPIGILFTTTDNPATAGGFFDVDNVSVTAVPEPAAAGLAAVGLLAALGRRRRVRRG